MSKPLVTIILMHHLDSNRPYLNLCLQSVKNSVGVDYELILLADSETAPAVDTGSGRLIYDKTLDTATRKIEKGIGISHPESKYFLILSDDVILSKYALANLVNTSNGLPAPMILSPMSNGDNGSRFLSSFWFDRGYGEKLHAPVNASLEDVKGFEAAIMNYHPLHDATIVMQPWVSFYCPLIPRTVWDKVGALDPRLETRGNDVDFCYRAAQVGVPSAILLSSFVFHFGSKTLSQSVKPGEQDEASRVFQEKWANPKA